MNRKAIDRHDERVISPKGILGIGIAVDVTCQQLLHTSFHDYLRFAELIKQNLTADATKPSKMYNISPTEQDIEAKASAMVLAFCSSHRRSGVPLRVTTCSRRNASRSDNRFRAAA